MMLRKIVLIVAAVLLIALAVSVPTGVGADLLGGVEDVWLDFVRWVQGL